MKTQYVFTKEGGFDYASTDDKDFYKDIYALFLNESSLVIRTKRKTMGMHGGHFYKTLRSQAYKVYTNQHGEKYLRSFRITDKNLFLSDDLQQMRNDTFLYGSRNNGRYCADMIAIIEDHLSSLLGFPFEYKACPRLSDKNWYKGSPTNTDNSLWTTAPEFLCYPFLRSEENRDLVMSLLKENQKRPQEHEANTLLSLEWNGVRGLNYALRNSNSPEEFVKNMVYKSAVKTEADVTCLVKNPSLLFAFSKFDLKMGAKEAAKNGYAEIFSNASHHMDIPEIYAFKFLLQYLPKKKTIEVLKLASHLAKFRSDQNINLYDLLEKRAVKFLSHQNTWKKQIRLYFQKIPVSNKTEFALSFWEEFKADYLKSEESFGGLVSLEGTWTEHVNECFTNVMDTYMRVYSATYVKTLPEDSLAKCAATALELFGVDLSEDKSLKSDTVSIKNLDVTVSFYDFRQQVSKRLHPSHRKNLFYMIKMEPETRDLWGSAFWHPSNILLSDYANLHSSLDLMLASDLEQILKKIAAKIDMGLAKLGREITPKNRMLYLESSAHSRKFNINWRYYDLGVPVDEVSLYKKAGFRSKRDIQFWLETKQSLPADMYLELLKDAAHGASDRSPQILSF